MSDLLTFAGLTTVICGGSGLMGILYILGAHHGRQAVRYTGLEMARDVIDGDGSIDQDLSVMVSRYGEGKLTVEEKSELFRRLSHLRRSWRYIKEREWKGGQS